MSERISLKRRGTILKTILANVIETPDSPHLIWTGRVPERLAIMFSQDSRRVNVVRYLWEYENGRCERRLRKICDVRGCVSPRCHEEIPNSVYHSTHRRDDKVAKNYVRWNDVNGRWYVHLVFEGRAIASRSFRKSEYSLALDFAEESLKKLRALREEAYARTTTSAPTTR